MYIYGAVELNLMLYVKFPQIEQKEWFIHKGSVQEREREKARQRARARMNICIYIYIYMYVYIYYILALVLSLVFYLSLSISSIYHSFCIIRGELT